MLSGWIARSNHVVNAKVMSHLGIMGGGLYYVVNAHHLLSRYVLLAWRWLTITKKIKEVKRSTI